MATNPERTSSGLLQINVINIQNNFPIQNARVTISYKGEPDRTVEQLTTNSSGQTEQVQLPAPPVEYSLEPSIIQPYSEYNLMVEAEGFEPLAISGTEILAQATAIQGLHKKCGIQRNIFHLAQGHHNSQCAGNHVLYPEPGIH